MMKGVFVCLKKYFHHASTHAGWLMLGMIGGAVVGEYAINRILFLIYVVVTLVVLQQYYRYAVTWFLVGCLLVVCRYSYIPEFRSFIVDTQTVEVLVVIEPIHHDKINRQILYGRILESAMSELVPGNRLRIETRLYPTLESTKIYQLQCRLFVGDDLTWQRWLWRHDIQSVCYQPRVLAQKNGRRGIFEYVWGIRQILDRRIITTFHEPTASYVRALLLGSRHGFSPDVYAAIQGVGLSHVFVISGMHVALLLLVLDVILIQCMVYPVWRFRFLSMGLVCFILLLGFPASATRGAVMGWLLLAQKYWGRPRWQGRMVLIMMVTMLFIEPRLLRYDIGWQLSVLAMMGIIWLQPVLRQVLFANKNNLVVDLLSIGLSAQIMTLGLSSFYFGSIAWWSVWLQFLIVPILPIIIGGIMLGLVMPKLCLVCVVEVYFRVFSVIVLYLNSSPFIASQWQLSWYGVWGYYSCLGIIILFFHRKVVWRKK